MTMDVDIEFVALEEWHKLEYEGNSYFENIEVEVKVKNGFNPGSDKIAVRKLWKDACRYVGYVEGAFPRMESVIRDKNSGDALEDLPEV